MLDSLLSLYADGAVSAEEALRVEAHLPGCAACRESLAWMRATRFALASRPVALPPADLRARIAEAIAASSAAPVPATFRTRRAFALRPALAAAASFVMLGFVGYGLLHHPLPASVHPVTPPQVAGVPHPPQSPPIVKTMTAHGVKPHAAHHSPAALQPARLDPDRVARIQPDEAVPASTAVKKHPQVKADTRMLADAAPVPAPVKSQPHIAKSPTARASHPELMATNKGMTPSAETHKAPFFKSEPKHTDTVVAEAPHTQTLSAPSIIEKQPVITHDPAPVVAVASSQQGRVQTAEDHGVVTLHYAMKTFKYATVGMVDKSAVLARGVGPDRSLTEPLVGGSFH